MTATTTVARPLIRRVALLPMIATLSLIVQVMTSSLGCASGSGDRTWAQTAEPVSPTKSTSSSSQFVSRQ